MLMVVLLETGMSTHQFQYLVGIREIHALAYLFQCENTSSKFIWCQKQETSISKMPLDIAKY
jgi:hypothetical protein